MYIVKELKELLKYKQIDFRKCKPAYKLKRTQLIKALQEPLYETFSLTHFEDNIKQQSQRVDERPSLVYWLILQRPTDDAAGDRKIEKNG